MMYRANLEYRVRKIQKSKRRPTKEKAVERHPMTLDKFIYRGALLVVELTVLYLLYALVTGHARQPAANAGMRAQELTTSLLQCLLGMFAIHVPLLVQRLAAIRLPGALCALFYLFVLGATVLGEVFSLYYLIPCWDSILHMASGVMAGMLGSIFIVYYFRKKALSGMASPLLVAIGAVCFSLCLGVVWEIYEFCADSLLGLNMQKAMLQNGTGLVGTAALADTMKDLMIDFAGALVAGGSAYLSLKHKKRWLYAYLDKAP